MAIVALGVAFGALRPTGAWLVPAGSLLILAGLTRLADEFPSEGTALRLALGVLCLGILIETAVRLSAIHPEPQWPSQRWMPDDLRLRMLHLARAAATALPVLAYLYRGLVVPASGSRALFRWGGVALHLGAAGMPLLLTATALTRVSLKYLLALPADAVFAGTLVGASVARRAARPLEQKGWLLVAASMAAGLLLGTFAFDGPLPAPGFIGGYGDLPRRLIRLGHASAIVLGLFCITVARFRDLRADGKG
jgi:hypothetical protein